MPRLIGGAFFILLPIRRGFFYSFGIYKFLQVRPRLPLRASGAGFVEINAIMNLPKESPRIMAGAFCVNR